MNKKEFLRVFKECLVDGNIRFEVEANGYEEQYFDVCIAITDPDTKEYDSFEAFTIMVDL